MFRLIALSLVLALFPSTLVAQPEGMPRTQARADGLRYIVSGRLPGHAPTNVQLAAVGAEVLAAYGSSHAVRVPAGAHDAFLERMAAWRLDVRELHELIETPGRRIDPRSDVPPVAGPGSGLFILQYAAPPLPDWQSAVRAIGLVEVLPLPERAIVVAGTREQVASIAVEPWIEYAGPYLAEYKFGPTGTDRGVFTIQIADTDGSREAIASIAARVGGLSGSSSTERVLTARFQSDRATAASLLNERFVLGVETFVPTQASDERQALSVTGKTDVVTAASFANAKPQLGTGSNYRRWLDFYGFTRFALTQSTDIVVDIADSGISQGCGTTPTSVQAHPDLRGRIVYHNGATVASGEAGQEQDPDYSDKYGHGTVIAGMVAGNPEAGLDTANGGTSGSGIKDPNQYYCGMGVAPGARLGSTVILDANGVERGPATDRVKDWTTRAVNRFCNTPMAPCTSTSQRCPATVQTHSHNEYEDTGTHAGQYTTTALEFDRSVRSADWSATGLPLAITVSSGNIKQRATDDTTMVLAPATAKNVISVGGTESDRDSFAGCTADGSIEAAKRHTAEDYTYLAYASRRGTVDNRLKPDLLAPATLSVGTRGYKGGLYCLNTTAMGIYPDNKPYYHGASGTSFAAPVAAGSIALLKHYYKRSPSPFGSENPSLVPSPAMYKAMLVAGARSLLNKIDRYTGTAITRWPNAQQGFGAISLEPLLDTTVGHGWRDQQATPLLQNQSQYFTVTVGDPTKPVRIVLAWTDAPGVVDSTAPFTKALTNDLDLRATWPSGLQFYGNVTNTSGYSYVPGCGRPLCPSPADVLNNVEVLNIDPALFNDPAYRTFTVRVWAAVLNAVGVPGASNGAYNQDYALYVLNGSLTQNP